MILVYEAKCPKCRVLKFLAGVFDLRQKITYMAIREKETILLLKEFYEHPPYNFHFIYNDRDLCFTGLKAVPMIMKELLTGFFWPYGGRGPYWLEQRHSGRH